MTYQFAISPMFSIGSNGNQMPKNEPTRVLLIDSCQTFGQGLSEIIGQSVDLVPIGLVGDPERILGDEALHPIDVVIMDVDMCDKEGITLLQRLSARYSGLSILLISYNDWDIYLALARIVGASGFLHRNLPSKFLVSAIRQVKHGPIFTSDQLQRLERWEKGLGARLRNLRPREWQVMMLLFAGLGNREIGEKLRVSENTVEKHVSSILRIMEVDSRTLLLNYLYTNHLNVLIELEEVIKDYL